MNKFFKNRALPFTCILNFYIRLASDNLSSIIIENNIEFFYGTAYFGISKKYNAEKDFFVCRYIDVLVYLDRSKIDFFEADSSFKLKVAGGSIRFLYLKDRNKTSERKLISTISDQDILGGFSIKEEWISRETLRTEKNVEFRGKLNCQLTEDHIWKGNNSGISTDEEMIAAINNTTLAGLTLTIKKKSDHPSKWNLRDSSYFTLDICLIDDGVHETGSYIFIYGSNNATSLEKLEEIWNNLQSYKDRFDGEPTMNSGGNSPESHKTPLSEEGGSEGTAERPYPRMKIDIFIAAMMFFAFVLGLLIDSVE